MSYEGRQDLSNRAVQLKMRLRSDLVNCTKYNIKTKIVIAGLRTYYYKQIMNKKK